METSFTHTLSAPLKIHDKTYKEFTFRRPTVGDMIEADRQPGEIASSAALAAICADVPFADFSNIRAEDYTAIVAAGSNLGIFAPPPDDDVDVPPTDKEGFSYTLRTPVEVDSRAYQSLNVRRAVVRDMIAAERQPGQVAGLAALAAACCGVPFSDFRRFDGADYRALVITGVHHGFFPPPAAEAGFGTMF